MMMHSDNGNPWSLFPPCDVSVYETGDLAALRYSPGDDATKEMLSAGMSDPDSDIRMSAIYAVAGRAAIARFKVLKANSQIL